MALISVFGASFYLTMRLVFVGREVPVPDVIALPVDEARATLNRSDLYLEATAERYDDRVAKGLVLSQDPPAGATIKQNRKVRVTVSLGPMEVSIPDVQGQTLRGAQISLQREGLRVGHVTYTHEPRIPVDIVMAQDPPPDDHSGEGAGQGAATRTPGLHEFDGRLDLLVSRGAIEPRYVMPDLRNRRLDEVAAFAHRASLRMGTVGRERMDGVARGRVIRQYPRPGYPVGRQDIISIVLSE